MERDPRWTNHGNRLTGLGATTMLRDLVKAIRLGNPTEALDILYRYVPDEIQRERVEQYRREPLR